MLIRLTPKATLASILGMNSPSNVHDIHQRDDLAFPTSLKGFQALFPDDAACAAYLEQVRWHGSFVCPNCHEKGEPYRFAARPAILRCRACQRDTGLMRGTVMQDTKTPLTTWFWGAYLVSTMTPGMSAVQFQRQLGLSRYETAFNILHKLRAGMVRQGRDRIGGNLSRGDHVEIDETYVGGAVRGEGRGPKDQVLVCAAVEVRTRPAKKGDKPMRRGGRYAGRLRLEIVPNRGEKALCGFVEQAIEPGAMVITDAWRSYNSLGARGYQHLPVIEGANPAVAEEFLPIVHLVFSNLKSWLQGTHHGRVEPKHLQTYLNEFTFRFNRRFYPFNAFRSLLGIGTNGEGPTYDGLYSGEWKHHTMASRHG
jgi:transposase-like protein